MVTNNTFNISETKLTNDLQLANNLAAIQYDDLELRMQQQIETLLTQLKEEKNTCHMLRGEVFSLKQRLAYNNSEEVTKIFISNFLIYILVL